MRKKYNNRFNNGNPRKCIWSDEDKRYLKAHYASTPIEDLAEYFGKTVVQVKAQANRQYLTKRTKKV